MVKFGLAKRVDWRWGVSGKKSKLFLLSIYFLLFSFGMLIFKPKSEVLLNVEGTDSLYFNQADSYVN